MAGLAQVREEEYLRKWRESFLVALLYHSWTLPPRQPLDGKERGLRCPPALPQQAGRREDLGSSRRDMKRGCRWSCPGPAPPHCDPQPHLQSNGLTILREWHKQLYITHPLHYCSASITITKTNVMLLIAAVYGEHSAISDTHEWCTYKEREDTRKTNLTLNKYFLEMTIT